MAVAAGESHHLVLDGRAIARPGALDPPRIERRAIEIVADQRMSGRRGGGDGAVDLGQGDGLGHQRQGDRRDVAGLALEARPIDAVAAQTRRRAGLQPAHGETAVIQGFRQSQHGVIAGPSGRPGLQAEMDDAAQEGPGGEHHTSGVDDLAAGRDHPGDRAAAIAPQVFDRRGADLEILLLRQGGLHGPAVELAVGLGARPAHRRPLGAVQHAVLDAGPVDDPAHEPVEGVDLTHQNPLGETADGGIAGHFANRIKLMGEQQGARTEARRGRRRLAAGVAAADDDHVIGGRGGGRWRVGRHGRALYAARPALSKALRGAAWAVSRETPPA